MFFQVFATNIRCFKCPTSNQTFQPNNISTKERVFGTWISTGEWRDRPCSSLKAYLLTFLVKPHMFLLFVCCLLAWCGVGFHVLFLEGLCLAFVMERRERLGRVMGLVSLGKGGEGDVICLLCEIEGLWNLEVGARALSLAFRFWPRTYFLEAIFTVLYVIPQ